MRILVDIGHPAHVHFYKNAIKELEAKGHEILVTARDKEVTVDLLKAYDIEHTVLSSMKAGKGNLIKEWTIRDYKLLNIARKFKPDVLTGILNPCVAHVSWVLRKKSIIFNDTEHATFAQKITYPFSDIICTPSCFNKPVGKKQVSYDGYHELAYLHPRYFTPDSKVLTELKLTEDDQFIILRFVSWGASHDIGHKTLTSKNKLDIVNKLKMYGRIFITSEHKLIPELEEYRISLPPEKMHHLLHYATLLYGDSATMASECAVLGTHSIFCDYAGRGYTDEEEKRYDLVYNFYDENTMGTKSLNKAVELLQDSNLKDKGRQKKEKLLADKIDVTEFMIDLLESICDTKETFS
jgi:predicted glycosyltransferase